MKITLSVFLLIFFTISISAQEATQKLTYKFYGFVRGDYYYDSRQSVASSEGLLFLYPKDKQYDAVGEDLNAVASTGLFAFNTRPGVEVSGLKVFDADVLARAEADFAGFGGSVSNSTVLRIRLAYVKMQWKKAALTLGQDWHPFFGPVIPGQISLSTGAPFQPFNRSPQARLDYKLGKVTLKGAAIYQFQFTSPGPEGKSNSYQRKAIIPELTAMIDYQYKSINAGAGINLLTLKPRTSSVIDDKIYKVDENLSSLSYTAYLKYKQDLFSAAIKTTYGQNTVNMTMLGGYGIKSIDQVTGKQKYTNFTHSSSWLNLSYGSKYLGNILLGYTKNLGTKDALVENSTTYGEGLNIKDLYRLSGTFSYNIKHFSVGLEYEFSTANYGDTNSFDWEEGTYSSTHSISNHRIIGVARYDF